MKILVVEDDELIAQTLRIILSDQNYAVELASDGQAGLELVEMFAYDLLLLDVMLPKLMALVCVVNCDRRATKCQFCYLPDEIVSTIKPQD